MHAYYVMYYISGCHACSLHFILAKISVASPIVINIPTRELFGWWNKDLFSLMFVNKYLGTQVVSVTLTSGLIVTEAYDGRVRQFQLVYKESLPS